jgi:hypothetical protein
MAGTTQSDFAEALLDRTRPHPAGLRSWTGAAPVKRYGIYRNNVATGLARALAARFPMSEKIVGEEFFTAMARDFALQNPPSSPVLLDYGPGFAEFVENFAPAQTVPYLADIVRLEDAQTRAYHARDIAPIEPEALSRLQPERMAGLTFIFHPAAAILRSPYPVVTIWSMNVGNEPLAPIKEWTSECALITRPELSVLTRRISGGSAIFVAALINGTTLGEAFEAALAHERDFDLGHNLADLLHAGAVTDIVLDPPLEA